MCFRCFNSSFNLKFNFVFIINGIPASIENVEPIDNPSLMALYYDKFYSNLFDNINVYITS